MISNQRRGEIKALTSLRGLAAMAVVLQHFSATAQSNTDSWIPSIIPHGYMAVDFFFVLSGFIMSYTYLAEFQDRGMAAYRPFLWKRIARIFPLGIAVTTAILLLGGVASIWGEGGLFINDPAYEHGIALAAAVNYLHLQGIFNSLSLNDPSWSVSVELAAYLAFPALILIMSNRRKAVTAAFLAICALVMLKIASISPKYDLGARSTELDLMRCVAEFSFGMLVHRVSQSNSAWCRIGEDRWTWLTAAICAAGFLLRIDLMAAATFPLVVLAFALNRGQPSRVLSSRIPLWLGTISFSIYLVHHMFRRPEAWLIRHYHPAALSPTQALAFAAIGSLSILPFAALAYHGVEQPGRMALNSMLQTVMGRRASKTEVRP